MSAQYDMAIGLDNTTLDKGVAQLYSDSDAKSKLFQGSEKGENNGVSYQADWSVNAAPVFTLSAPDNTIWQASINDQGVNLTGNPPASCVFQLIFSDFQASLSLGGASPVKGSAKVIVTAQIVLSGSSLSLVPLGIWLDQSRMSGWDKFILDQIVLKNVLQQASSVLSGIKVPPLSFSKSGVSVEFLDPVATITNGYLVMATSLKDKNSVNIDGVKWPEKSLFSLVSADVMKTIATQAVKKLGIEGEKKSGSGDYKGLMKYSYTAILNSIEDITPNSQDMTKISAKVAFSFSSTADPLGIGGPCAISAATGSL